jgi:hypothetical protein
MLYVKGERKRIEPVLSTDGVGGFRFAVSATEDGAARAWVVWVHVSPGQQVVVAALQHLLMVGAGVGWGWLG